MRINNILQFTEHHRYYIFRDFAMSSLDHKMLSLIYQPMIGAFAISLYHQLYHGIPEDRSGFSELVPQRKILLGLGLEMNEQSRKLVVEQTSRLEAVGLLHTTRLGIPHQSEIIYEYELVKPLSPTEFFQTMHLTMLLRDKVGKYALIELRESFGASEPDEIASVDLSREEISVPFYELFQLNMQSFDTELEQALTEVAPTRQSAARNELASAGIPYGEIIVRFPRNSANRAFVERLRSQTEQLAQVNYIAYKYQLSVAQVCRLLDEDGVFEANGDLSIDGMQLRANQLYRQDNKRDDEKQRILARTAIHSFEEDGPDSDNNELDDEIEVKEQDYLPVPNQLTGRCDVQQYNMLMRNEPHTRFLKRFFPGSIPDWLENVFERIDLNYRLAAPVINVLIHYVLGASDAGRVTKQYLESVASNMLMKGVDSFEKAVHYVREQAQIEVEKQKRKETTQSFKNDGSGTSFDNRSRGNRGGGSSRKPIIPIVSEDQPSDSVSDEELAEIRKLARKLDGKL